MRKWVLIVTGLFWIINAQAFALEYDLDSYIDAVLKHNKDLQLAVHEKEIAKAQKKEALATALPKIGIEAGYTRNITDYYMYFDMGSIQPGAGIQKVPALRNNEFSSSLGIEQTLFSPTVGNALTASKQYQKLTDHAYEYAKQNVITGAKKVFYQCLLLEELKKVALASELNAKDNYENVRLKYENGQVSQFELLQSETRWKAAIPDRLQAERNLTLALNSFRNLAGISLNEPVKLKGTLAKAPELPQRKQTGAVLEYRPDYQMLEWESKLRETNVKASKLISQISLKGNLAYALSAASNEMKLDEKNDLLLAGVTLSVPLYLGGYQRAQVQKAKVEVAKTNVNISKKAEEINNEIENAFLRMKEARQRIELANATMKTAQKAFTIAETTTHEGLTTQLQLKDARFAQDQAQISYYMAIYDYLDAIFDYKLATGEVDKSE